jgi:dUTP pyrophosphatase
MEMQVRPRSGLSLKSDLMVCNSPGTVDSDYRGELMVIIGNFGNRPYTIEHGTRIAQIVFCPVLRVELEDAQDLSKTTREGGGFGSTGSK